MRTFLYKAQFHLIQIRMFVSEVFENCKLQHLHLSNWNLLYFEVLLF